LNVGKIPSLLDTFNEKYRGPAIHPVELSPRYDLSRDWIARKPEGKFPFSHFPGVYVFVDETEDVVYVGKASNNNTLGQRVSSYFKGVGGGKAVARLAVCEKVRFVHTIKVSESFFSAAVEEFLIQRLDPTLNRHGRLKKEALKLAPQ